MSIVNTTALFCSADLCEAVIVNRSKSGRSEFRQIALSAGWTHVPSVYRETGSSPAAQSVEYCPEHSGVIADPSASDFLTISSVARIYGIHAATVYRRIKDGTLTPYRIGTKHVRLNRHEVERAFRGEAA